MKRSGLKRAGLSPGSLKPGGLVPSAAGRARRKIEHQLDDLCRKLVVERRDQNTCQRCGAPKSRSQIHWCHVITRGAKSIQWTEWNSLALCAGCHFWFDGEHRKHAREGWWAGEWPDRALALQAWRQQRRRPKLDYALIRMYLMQQLSGA